MRLERGVSKHAAICSVCVQTIPTARHTRVSDPTRPFVTDLNPQAKQMADESMVRNLSAQAQAIWPQEVPLLRRYPLPSAPRILDAGCGTGEASSRLAELFPRASVLGVDIVDSHLELARTRFAELAPRLSFEHQSVFELQAADRSFDLAVCRHVIHSIPYPDRVMAQLARIAWRLGSVSYIADG